MKRSKVIIPIVLGICIVGVLTTAALISKFAPSKQHMELSKYFGIKGNQVKVILEDTICEQSALFQEKEIYVDFGTRMKINLYIQLLRQLSQQSREVRNVTRTTVKLQKNTSW